MVGTFRSPFSEAGSTLRSYHSAINSNVTFLTGDGREVRRTLPEKSVHCCVTRPPYCGLRSYTGEPGMDWVRASPSTSTESTESPWRDHASACGGVAVVLRCGTRSPASGNASLSEARVMA